MRKARIGIVGLGAIARNTHVPVLSSFRDVSLESAAEVDIKRAEEFAKRWNIGRLYGTYEDMYRDGGLDAVFVCLPNFLHHDAVRGALDHGLHVFCEKPMGSSAGQARDLVGVARKKDLFLAVGYNMLLEPSFEAARKTVKSMRLGKVIQLNGTFVSAGPYAGWVPDSDWLLRDRYAVLYDQGSHLISLILSMLGTRIVEIAAKGVCTMHGFDIFDNVACVFKTESGALGTLNVGWKFGYRTVSLDVHGTGGSIFADPWEIQIRYRSHGQLERLADHITFAKRILTSQAGRLGKDRRQADTYLREDRAFVDAVLHGGAPIVSGEQGLQVLEVLDAVKESIDKCRVAQIG
jgi:predicted dehydrogenase